MNDAKCPSCDHEVSDAHNGGDPRAWWDIKNIPDAEFKHKCDECGVWFKVDVSWSPFFDCEIVSDEELDELEEV